jgi:tetratricopeptide (TPR) repeat protein
MRRPPAPALALALALAATARAHVGIEQVERGVAAELAKHPDDPARHLDMARAHAIAREWDAALAELEDAARLGADPDVVGATKGQVFLDAGWPRMARIELDRVVARRPDAYGARFDRGRASAALGDVDAAARDYRAAIAGLASPQPEQVLALRDVLVGAGRRAEAVDALDAGIARLGPVPTLVLAAVDLEQDLGRPDAALARLDALSATGTPNPAWVARRGELLARAGRAGDARTEYRRALALIDARPPGRASAFHDLRQRLETALAETIETTGGSHP